MEQKYPKQLEINHLSYTAVPFAHAAFQRKWDCQRYMQLEVRVPSPWVFQMEDSNTVTAPTHREVQH